MNSFTRSAANLAIFSALCAAASAQLQPGLRLQPNGRQKPSAAIPLPVNSPTQPLPPPLQQAQPLSTATISTVRRASVTYTGGLLTVTANNSSLNQILREIARQTGIKITGGVNDERVYGTYGPSALHTILAVLLGGTGSNMMLSGDTPEAPQVLTLTPRLGGPTPPSPSAAGYDEPEAQPASQDLPPQLTPRTANDPIGRARPVEPPQPNAFTPPTAAAPQPDAATAPPATTTTTEQSPNGVKTPQQVYDQLMKLQSQQPKAPQ